MIRSTTVKNKRNFQESIKYLEGLSKGKKNEEKLTNLSKA